MQCGCSFDVDETALNKRGKPLNYYTDNHITPPVIVPYKTLPDCPLVWEMLGNGYTKGVFQLESGLGRTYAKKLKPENVEHLSALGALLRPGSTQNKDEKGINTADHYCFRKNGLEDVDYPHESLKSVLSSTYGVVCYQEQSLNIAQIIAGFDMKDADSLRRAIGKKIPEEMAKCRTMFIEGAKKVAIASDEVASDIFDGIEKSQRYSFNKAHSWAYAINGFRASYIKIHFPLHFFCSYLIHARHTLEPYEEIEALVNEAKIFGITMYSPSLNSLKKYYHLNDKKGIRLGIVDIKGIGDSQFGKIKALEQQALLKYGKKLAELEWNEFLYLSDDLSKTVVENLISSGATNCYVN